MNRTAVSLIALLTLLLLVPSLNGCAAPSPIAPLPPLLCPRPEIPALPPSLAKPPPQESYLEAARRDISQWLQQLKSTATR